MKTILVTGGNRGIGLEACKALAKRGAKVLLAARDLAAAEKAAAEIGAGVVPVELDVTDQDSVEAAAKKVGAVDVIVNNAGVYLDGSDGVLALDDETIGATLDVNLLGVWRVCRAFGPGLVRRGEGRIVNVSSGMGQLSEMKGGQAAYRVSKAALNALTLVLADELKPVTVIALCPGWVATDMGGASAPRKPADAGEAVAVAALEDDRTGIFIRDGQPIAW